MPNDMTEAEILDFLHAVEVGNVILDPLQEPQNVYDGGVEYAATNGWRVSIWNDCNEWDYIDHIRTEDGRECDYDFIFEHMPLVDVYQPPKEIAWSRYRIPGYMKFRCVRCGRLIKPGWPPFVCWECESPLPRAQAPCPSPPTGREACADE